MCGDRGRLPSPEDYPGAMSIRDDVLEIKAKAEEFAPLPVEGASPADFVRFFDARYNGIWLAIEKLAAKVVEVS